MQSFPVIPRQIVESEIGFAAWAAVFLNLKE